MLKNILILVCTLLAFNNVSFAGSKKDFESVTLALNWHAVGDHAPYWVALEKGFYYDEGLDVTLEASKGSVDSLFKIEAKRADFALSDSMTVIMSQSKGAKNRIVGMVFDKTPLSFFSRADSPILKPKDLEGKIIGAPPGDSGKNAFPAFAKMHNIDVNKVQWANLATPLKPIALKTKSVDSVVDFYTAYPVMEAAMGPGSVVAFKWSDTGFDVYGMAIVASNSIIDKNPEVVRKFLRASYKGWQYTMQHPEEAVEIFKRRVPEINPKIVLANMNSGFEFMRTNNYKTNGLGFMENKKMCSTVDIVNTYMDIPNKVSCSNVYTNKFLTKIELPLSVLK